MIHRRSGPLALLLASLLALGGCAGRLAMPGPPVEQPSQSGDAFVMPDGARLPYRAWLPERDPWAVVLALHGMNDSRDAWELPGPAFAGGGIALFAPDQRGFGATADRGYWPTATGLVEDAKAMARLLRHRYPQAKLFLMGESMGGAVAMVAATRPGAPPVDGYVLLAPAVWGRAEMDLSLRLGLWMTSNLVPGWTVGSVPGVRIAASDNREALVRLSRNPLTLKTTRMDAVRGLVDLMDEALDAASAMPAPALFLYGARDELVPPRATAETWRRLPPDASRALYADGWHLLFRDRGRDVPVRDAIAWMRDPAAPLPSGAERSAAAWIASREADAASDRASLLGTDRLPQVALTP